MRAGQRGAEHGHDRIADILVEQPLVAHHHLDHFGEIVVEHRHRAARAEPLGEGREAANVGKQHGDFLVGDEERVVAAFHHLVDDFLGEIARHRRAHALFRGDVLDHHEEADGRVVDVDQRVDGEVDRDRAVALAEEIAVGVVVAAAAAGDEIEAADDPVVRRGEHLLRRVVDDVVLAHAGDAQGGVVHLQDAQLGIERHDAVAEAL